MTAALVGGKGKSSDYGATWATLGSLPVGSHWCFAYAGPGRFIAANAVVRYSPDFGATWENKENSSLTSIVPFPNINMLKVLGF